jgi:TonB family protein
LNIKTTYQLFKKWLQGDVNLEEQRQLTKESEKDAFLKDAIEGYDLFPEGKHLDRIAAINASVRAKSQKRSVGVSWLRIAATIVLLLAVGSGFWWLNQSGTDQVADIIEKTEENNNERATEPEETLSVGEDRQPPPPASTETVAEAPKNVKRQKKNRKEKIVAPALSESPINDVASVETTPTPPPPIIFTDKQEQEAFTEKEEYIAVEMEDLSARTAEPPAAFSDDALQMKDDGVGGEAGSVFGQIVTANTGEPLIGATILEKGTANGTISDVDGNFSLPLTDEKATLIISYTGFTSTELFVTRGDTILSSLYTGQLLDEVVVTGGNLNNRKSKSSYNQPPKPVAGLYKYRRYVKRNLMMPEAAIKAGIKGEVILSFSVASNGKPRDIQVSRSLGYGCDQEAIRLLTEGPEWEPTSTRINYTFEFK